ncbi:M16 family metallopeptidase [Nakamurella deserti]|uniref:M16 family metallopeptidase n=1 Tax=Nakamurella deserti TaxID=2164074 RepID=UPI000DBE21F2|nr:pitrilysin family protein [Nakamurella deserti]
MAGRPKTPAAATEPGAPARAARAPRRRTAAQIGRTPLGARPVPALTAAVGAKNPRTVDTVLDNGLRVIAVRKAGTPLIEARLRIPFSATRVPAQVHSARAEMLAATLMLGTGTRDRQQVDADLAVVGGHLDASVDAQRLMVAGSVLSTGLPTLLAVLADSLTDPAFRSDEIRVERARLHEHLMISLSQPSAVARKHLQERRFGDHAAAWDTPLAEDVDAVTPAVVRSLFRRQAVPDGAVLVLVGDLSPARAVSQVAEALGDWRSDRAAVRMTPPPPVEPAPLAAFDNPGAVQSQVRLSAPAVGREHEGYPAQQLANLVYGGYFSSRLVENIREDKGFTYSASSSVSFWPGRAAVTVGFDTTTESTAAAVWEAQYELGRMALTPPSDAEVESARNYALGTLAASLATQAGYASMISQLAGSGLDGAWLDDYRAGVAAVTAAEVHELARTIFAPSAFMGVVVGDLTTVAAPLSAVLPVELP